MLADKGGKGKTLGPERLYKTFSFPVGFPFSIIPKGSFPTAGHTLPEWADHSIVLIDLLATKNQSTLTWVCLVCRGTLFGWCLNRATFWVSPIKDAPTFNLRRSLVPFELGQRAGTRRSKVNTTRQAPTAVLWVDETNIEPKHKRVSTCTPVVAPRVVLLLREVPLRI